MKKVLNSWFDLTDLRAREADQVLRDGLTQDGIPWDLLSIRKIKNITRHILY